MNIRAKKVLVIVDVQNDFIEGGSLAVDGGRDMSERLVGWLIANNGQNDYDAIYTTQDWHKADDENGGHIALPPAEPDYVDSWPIHCIASENGSDFAPALKAAIESGDLEIDAHFYKGYGTPAYSGFEGFSQKGETLALHLNRMLNTNVVHVDVVGIATEHCVRATSIDSARGKFPTTVLKDFIVGIDPERVENFLEREAADYRIAVK